MAPQDFLKHCRSAPSGIEHREAQFPHGSDNPHEHFRRKTAAVTGEEQFGKRSEFGRHRSGTCFRIPSGCQGCLHCGIRRSAAGNC